MPRDDKRGRGGLGSRLRGRLHSDLKDAGSALKDGRIKNRWIGRAVRRGEKRTVRGELLEDRLLPGQEPSARLPDEVIARSWHPTHPVLAVVSADGTLSILEWHASLEHLEPVWRSQHPELERCLAVRWGEKGRCVCAVTTEDDDLFVSLDGAGGAGSDEPPAGVTWTHEPAAVSADGAWHAQAEDGALFVRRVRSGRRGR